jgi:beta-exotoxin I transport system ATP-binding protein
MSFGSRVALRQDGAVSGTDVIVAEGLTKSYGTTRGVTDLTFRVEAGEVFGYLGPNGAGKSTTIRTMLDFLRPTSGRVTVFGMKPRTGATAIHARIGYVPGEFGLYERMKVRDYLEAFAAFRGGAGARAFEKLAERLDLDLSREIRELSHGNRQKVGLVQAFMHEPDLLVLDEPTQGLDPLVQQTFYGLIDETRARGGTVFLSSHILPEVERTCDRVGIIREGRLLTVDDVGGLKAKALRSIEFHFNEPVDPARFASLPSVVSVEAHGDSVAITIQGELDEVVKEAARHTVVNVETREPSLEEIFLRTYEDGGDES